MSDFAPSRRVAAHRLSVFALAVAATFAAQAQTTEVPLEPAPTWNWTTLSNADWEIQLTEAGYSDYLFDRTPGYDGREYLSGEWAAAVGYTKSDTTVSPQWLERNFSFPNFATNSTFDIVSPTSFVSGNGGLPAALASISNGDLLITQRFELIDTGTGVAMGLSSAGAGSGSSILSNRYALQQTYTFTNVSGQTLSGLQLFQLLHGLESQSGVYDNRSYGGALSDYRYDVTLQGVSTQTSNGGEVPTLPPDDGGGELMSSAVAEIPQSTNFRDYIGFHSKIAPSAVEIGAFGNPEVDSHSEGKPSIGTVLAVEANNLNGSTSYSNDSKWIAGAQRFDLGELQAGQSVSFDMVLTILTGWGVDAGNPSGVIGGTGDSAGSVAYRFEDGQLTEDDNGTAQFFVSYEVESLEELNELIAAGEFGALTFETPGSEAQLFEVELDGATFEGMLELTFTFDTSLLPVDFDPLRLGVYHWTGSEWEYLGGTVNGNRITVLTSSLSPFAIGVAQVPEPSTAVMTLLALAAISLKFAGRRRAQSVA